MDFPGMAQAAQDEATQILMQRRLVREVKHYADTHYNQGWDIVLETMEDRDILETIGRARTTDGALRNMYTKYIKHHYAAQREHQAEAQAMA